MNENGKMARLRNGITLALFLLGVALSGLALAADYLGLDRTPGFGMVQMFVFLVGLTMMTLAAFLHVHSLRRYAPRSLQADIGVRLAATGLVFAYVSGLADLLGIGNHPHPDYPRPFVGWLQWTGVALGIFSILVGLVLYYSSRRGEQASSLEFVVNGHNGEAPESQLSR